MLVEQVLARNPTLAQMVAAWQAAAARYPQVMALDDPTFGFMAAPASIGSNNVEFGYRLELAQKLPYCGKRELRGQSALAEAGAAAHDVSETRLQLIDSARSALAVTRRDRRGASRTAAKFGCDRVVTQCAREGRAC